MAHGESFATHVQTYDFFPDFLYSRSPGGYAISVCIRMRRDPLRSLVSRISSLKLSVRLCNLGLDSDAAQFIRDFFDSRCNFMSRLSRLKLSARLRSLGLGSAVTRPTCDFCYPRSNFMSTFSRLKLSTPLCKLGLNPYAERAKVRPSMRRRDSETSRPYMQRRDRRDQALPFPDTATEVKAALDFRDQDETIANFATEAETAQPRWRWHFPVTISLGVDVGVVNLQSTQYTWVEEIWKWLSLIAPLSLFLESHWSRRLYLGRKSRG